ncbi:MAG: hypothetical protein Q9227_002903 [Pyrenula ochraceoflavens]
MSAFVLLFLTYLGLTCLTSGTHLLATHYSGTISTLELTLNNSTGIYNLTNTPLTTCGAQPSWLTYDASSKTLYCIDEAGTNTSSLSSYHFSHCNGTLTLLAQAQTLPGPVHSALYGGNNGNAQYIALAHYSGALSTFKLPLTNTSTPLQNFTFPISEHGPDPEHQKTPHAHMVLFSPQNTSLLVPDLGADLLRLYTVNATTGMLTSCGNVTTPPGSGPRHARYYIPPSASSSSATTANSTTPAINGTLFLVSELSNTLSTYSVADLDKSCPKLSLNQTLTPFQSNHTIKGSAVAEIHIPPLSSLGNGSSNATTNQQTLHISNRMSNAFGNNSDSLSTFTVSNNSATFSTGTPSFGSYPRTFAVNVEGNLVAVANQEDGTVSIVKRDPITGGLGSGSTAAVANVSVGAQGKGAAGGGVSSVVWAEELSAAEAFEDEWYGQW